MFGAEWLSIQGAVVFTPAIYDDDLGEHVELFSMHAVTAAVGRPLSAAKAGCSVSRRGALRGIHFTAVPTGQPIFLTCVSGTVLYAVVDVRVNSPSFGSWELVQLDDRTRRGLYLEEGLGHGHLSLAGQSTVIDLCSEPQGPATSHRVHPLDPELGIAWPAGIAPILSADDAAAPTLAQARTAGLLPDYLACLMYYGGVNGPRQAGPAGSPGPS